MHAETLFELHFQSHQFARDLLIKNFPNGQWDDARIEKCRLAARHSRFPSVTGWERVYTTRNLEAIQPKMTRPGTVAHRGNVDGWNATVKIRLYATRFTKAGGQQMENSIKVGELKKRLEGIPDDWDLTFGGVLEFNRTKMRGPKLIDIEFNQSIYRDSSGRIVLDDLTFEGR